MRILGVEIDDITKKEAIKIIKNRLEKGEKTFIATPNPEMLVLAQKNKDFYKILNQADIKIADGAGLKLGARILGKKLKNRLTGVDFMVEVCRFAKEKNLSIYLLGANSGVARKAGENLKKAMPGIQILKAESGGKMEDWDNRVIIEHIKNTCPDILFIALGHGKQEKWISKNLPALASVRIAMGVGGAFDFISGNIKRAPNWMRDIGLEWLYRLIKEPKRIKRIINAVIVFPLMCFFKS